MQVIHSFASTIFLSIVFFVLIVVAGLVFLKREILRRHAPRIFLYSAGLSFAYLIYLAYLQFKAFYEGQVLAPVLGTWEGLYWFLGYVRLHFWNEYLISLPVALLAAYVAYYFNRKYQERFFEREEPFLAALGILLVGYPGFLFYLPLALLVPSVASAIFVKRGERLPLYHFWIPVAIIVLLVIQFWAKDQGWWGTFRF